MVKYLLLLALAVVGLTGCAETYTLSCHSTAEQVADADKHVRHHANQIVFSDGTGATADDVSLTTDSVLWMLPDSSWHGAGLQTLGKVTRTNHDRGLLEGGALGFGFGVMLGLPIVMAGARYSHGTLLSDGIEAPLFPMNVLAPAFMVSGMLIGTAVGHRTTVKYDSTTALPEGTPRPVQRNAKGWAMPGTADSTGKR